MSHRPASALMVDGSNEPRRLGESNSPGGEMVRSGLLSLKECLS